MSANIPSFESTISLSKPLRWSTKWCLLRKMLILMLLKCLQEVLMQWIEDAPFINKITTRYLKNHWTRPTAVCTHLHFRSRFQILTYTEQFYIHFRNVLKKNMKKCTCFICRRQKELWREKIKELWPPALIMTFTLSCSLSLCPFSVWTMPIW